MDNNIVMIKSFPNGFDVILSDKCSFEEIKEAVEVKFTESSKFFGKAKKAISFSGRDITAEQENLLIEVIGRACDIDICCIIEKDEKKDGVYLKALKQFSKASEAAKGNIYKGTIPGGSKFDTSYSVIIIGDVNTGAVVRSAGSVVVLGTVYGTVMAGMEELSDRGEMDITYSREDISHGDLCFIAALDMKHPTLIINGKEASGVEKALKVPLLSKCPARIAYEHDGEIVIDSINKEFIASIDAKKI